MVASCGPWDASSTVSLSGQRVAVTRACRSSRSASGTWIVNGRIPLAVFSATAVMAWVCLSVSDLREAPETGRDAGAPNQRHRRGRRIPGAVLHFSDPEVTPGAEGPLPEWRDTP